MPDPTIFGLVVVGFYVLVVLLAVAADMVARRDRRIARLEAALAASEARRGRRAPHDPGPAPAWTVRVPQRIEPTGKPINELAAYVRHAGPEWRNGPSRPMSGTAEWPVVPAYA